MKTNAMTVAGVMSGTSADGVDVALVRIEKQRGRPALTLLAHEGFPYPAVLRRVVLGAMNAASTTTAELARLNWRLALAYADAVRATIRKHRVSPEMRPQLIGCHGQTLYHQGVAAAYAGRRFNCTWQAGEAAVLAQELGIPVASNFRPADMAAGGQGAPLVPLLDYVMFANGKRGRVLQNIGGIANLTAIPAGAGADGVLAFDTGPGNMVTDALAREHTKGRLNYDRGGKIAQQGHVNTALLDDLLRDPYYRRKAPKSAGREQYGTEFVDRLKASGLPLPDLIATATVLTASTIAMAARRHHPDEMIVSGGGVHNPQIMAYLAALLPDTAIASSSDYGVDADAKEAIAFAVLAYETWRRRPSNLPSATGARRAVVLGSITP